jgi:hypothetical protein
MMRKLKFKENDKIGRLTIIRYLGKLEDNRFYYLCKCDCGNETKLRTNSIGKLTNSCGCIRKEVTSKRFWKGYGEISGSYWNSIRCNASDREIKLEITIQQAWELFLKQERKCALTGLLLEFGTRENFGFQGSASLDRIDSNMNYTIDNVHWVHRDINKMKMEFPMKRFLEMCNLVVNYNNVFG